MRLLLLQPQIKNRVTKSSLNKMYSKQAERWFKSISIANQVDQKNLVKH